jgi:hypothetical protein
MTPQGSQPARYRSSGQQRRRKGASCATVYRRRYLPVALTVEAPADWDSLSEVAGWWSEALSWRGWNRMARQTEPSMWACPV